MSAFAKGKLKLIKEALAAKDWATVQKQATGILDFESNNYNARVFLSLALFNLDKFDEAEESYKRAIQDGPSQPLARQGLATFYEKRQRWTDYAWALLELMSIFEASQDALRYAETLQKLLAVRRAHGSPEELIDALHLLLPSSPSYHLLASLPPADPTNPTASTVHSLQLTLRSSLPTLLELTALISNIENTALESEVSKRRQRLGGQTLSAAETRRRVQAEQMANSRLPALYRAVLNDPDASSREDLRRETEKKLLVHLVTLLGSLPSEYDLATVDLKKQPKRREVLQKEAEEKNRVRDEVEDLARGMVIVRVADEQAWRIVLEWSDRNGELNKIDWSDLGRYIEMFPESGLASIAQSVQARAAAKEASPPAEEDEEEERPAAPKAPTDDEMVELIEKALAACPDSVLAHTLAASHLESVKDWEGAAQVCEAGISTIARLAAEIGRPLPNSRRTLETTLAIALAYLDAPTHHLRALRLLDSLISTATQVSGPLLTAKAFVLQSNESYMAAVELYDAILALPSDVPLDLDDEWIAAMGRRAWCLFLAGELERARVGLSEVVSMLEARKERRDTQEKELQKARSKAGLAKEEGIEEGETVLEQNERAEGWWRLGQCYWQLGALEEAAGEKLDNYTAQAYDAFTDSIRAFPTFAPAFTSLGLYYRAIDPPDLPHASKCFQKAFELDGREEVAARFLAEELALLEEWSTVEVIAKRVVEGATQGKGGALGKKAAVRLAWAYKAIGGAELKYRHYPQAIVALQAALRGAPEDVHTWIKLGVSYRHSGKHVAALKVFSKALKLDPTSWYARFSIGDVQREMGLLEPALSTFRSIFAERPKELGVRVVLAETALMAALKELEQGLLVRAEDSLAEALGVAVALAEEAVAERVAWKVAADAMTALAKITEPSQVEGHLVLARRLVALIGSQGVDGKMERTQAVTAAIVGPLLASSNEVIPAHFGLVAVLCYKMRVLLEAQNDAAAGSAWLDLGVALAATRTTPFAPTNDLETSNEDILLQAITCVKYALHKEPFNALFWNALGVLAFHLSPRLAQHCFIKAIEHAPRSAIGWTNLGLFYLEHEDDELANQAFLKAQVLDPDWTQAWVGQANLAERAGHFTQSAQLLEHAFTLSGSVPEADLGYAQRAWEAYRHIHNFDEKASPTDGKMAAVSAAALSGPLFALTRYLARRPEDITALHLYALILERTGDRESAAEALESAAAKLEALYEVDESPEVEGRFVKAQVNLGRVRLYREDYDGAIEAFEAAGSLINLEADEDDEDEPVDGDSRSGAALTRKESVLLFAECKLGTALAQFWLGDNTSAQETLESGLEDLETVRNSRRANLAIVLGRLYWSEGDEDRALTSFMDAPDAVVTRGPLFVKLAMHALAIVTNDNAILASVKRVKGADPHIKYHPDMTHLAALQELIKGNPGGAMSALSRTLHGAPWVTGHRRRLSTLMVQAADPVGELEALRRFLREKVSEVEGGEDRAGRGRLLALGRLARRPREAVPPRDGEEEGGSPARAGGEQEAERYLEKCVYMAPWANGFRKDLAKVRTARGFSARGLVA